MKWISLCFFVMLIFWGCDHSLTDEQVKESTKMEMVLIPAGSFQMGANDPEGWMSSAHPIHTVEVDAFYMDVHEVTVGQFKKFVAETGHSSPRYGWQHWDLLPADYYPVINVNWDDATAYSKWVGKRLPTEAEWEYAARGGLVGKRYIWGDDEAIARNYANYHGIGGKDIWGDQNGLPAPVRSLKPNNYGLFDMAGNVWEWCSDFYDENYYVNSPKRNPRGPIEVPPFAGNILRGGSYRDSLGDLRVAYRNVAHRLDALYGFRCVTDVN